MMPNLSTHKPWEHWLAMTLGLLIGVSPWLARSLDSPFVVLNAVVAGLLVLSVGGLQLVALRASEEWLRSPSACGWRHPHGCSTTPEWAG